MLERLAIFLVGAGLVCAQAPANFEESVRAAMAPGVAEQRVAVQKQAAATVRHTNSTASSDSFFTVPFASTQAGSADCDPLPKPELNSLIESASQKSGVDAQLVRAV